MNKISRNSLLFVVILIGLTMCFGFGFFLLKSDLPEVVVSKFWGFSLENKVAEALELRTQEKTRSKKFDDGTSASTNTSMMNDSDKEKEIFLADIDNIYKNKIKIDKVFESRQEKYQAGVVIETTNQKNIKKKYIACLIKVSNGEVWKINSIDVFEEPDSVFADTIGHICFGERRELKTDNK